MDTAIRVKNVSKLYRLGEFRGYRTIRESLESSLLSLFKKNGRGNGADQRAHLSRRDNEELWALEDVSFDVKRGEVVGIIGRNGAGKSTLLKIISRITEPTLGEVELWGRVASLLEVGTGFHPELTGRENIYLNGSVLGMRKKEIDRKFDEIVDFSGVEKFIDTPVKRYSSGMNVRLAFAVAAHLEPEILLIDEVLAVGDAEFQRKCLGKMDDVARGGRTIVFVSHNLAAVENLCGRGLLLEAGSLKRVGPMDDVIEEYMSDTENLTGDFVAAEHPSRVTGAKRIVQRFQILDVNDRSRGQVGVGEKVTFAIHLSTDVSLVGVMAGIHVYNWMGQRVTSLHTRYQMRSSFNVCGKAILRCTVPTCDLMPGMYRVVLDVSSHEGMLDRIDPIATFEVLPRDIFGTGRTPPARDGVFVSRGIWRLEH